MATDGLLFRLKIQSMYAYCKTCKSPEWGYENLLWYIGSGRAPEEFCKKIERLSDAKMRTLIRRSAEGCTEKGIKNAKKYLGIKEEYVL